MSIQGLPRDAEFLAQIADLGFWLPHCRHCQAQLGCRHFERPTAFPATCPRRRKPCYGALGDQLTLELGESSEDGVASENGK